MNWSPQYSLLQLKNHQTIENFTLTVTTPGNRFYKQSVNIFTSTREFSTLIQTDKSVYKPDDKVQFRILLLNGEMKPYQSEILNVNVTNSHGVTVYERNDLKKEFDGVWSGELKISDTPPLGKWTISAEGISGGITSRSFEVSEYVLPRFFVQIDSPQHVLRGARKVKIVFFGQYTFGEFVEGIATITTKIAPSIEKLEMAKMQNPKTVKVFAKKTIELDFIRDLNLKSSGFIQIVVKIEEKSTGKTAKVTEIIQVHEKEEHSIELIREKNIRPGFPFSLKAVVRKYDGTLESSEANVVKFTTIFIQSRPKKAEYMSRMRMGVNGIANAIERNQEVKLSDSNAVYTFDVPKSALGLMVKVNYLEAETQQNITRFPSQCNEYLKAEIVVDR